MTHAWTGSGYLDLFNPDPEDIEIADIARNLSRIPRYSGSTLQKWTVAQHSLFCVRLGADAGLDRDDLRALLLHDAPEYITGDLINPIKSLPGFEAFKAIDANLARAVHRKFGLEMTPARIAAVRYIDRLAYAIEVSVLVPPHEQDEPHWGDRPDVSGYRRALPHLGRSEEEVRDLLQRCLNEAMSEEALA